MSYETSRLVSTQSRCLGLVLLKYQYNHDHAIQASKFFLKFYIMVNLKANVVEQYWNFDKFLNFGSIQCSFKYLKKVLCTIEDSTNLTSFKCQWCAIKTGWKVSTLIDILILKQLFCWCKDSIPWSSSPRPKVWADFPYIVLVIICLRWWLAPICRIHFKMGR